MTDFGIFFPIQKSSERGYFRSSKSLLEVARSNILSLLYTNKGERLIHTEMGCDLGRFLFDPLTTPAKNQIEANIKSEIVKWLPYVKIDEINVSESESGHGLHVKIKFSIIDMAGVFDIIDVNYE